MDDSPARRAPAGPTTYLDDVLAGRAAVDDIDDYIGRWHELPSAAPDADLPLHHYLGFTWDEYSRWLQQPSAAQDILDAHRR